ncbi:MAG TPA: STAS domain-containing protein [Anaerohalosphaeraceae bacterium]|nr:STAS domain-containing protein [Anaerohalosphaeraceae bacterium]HRT49259.1 STAS domain-containing protein [Anaerohalosphaeraceae bacterium]HRT85202.1 STAS domain-containing protein [Anaerohalosphaeraceae bacterium]
MKIQTQNYNDVTVVELQGEFTSELIKPFVDTMTSIVAGGAFGIVLDMSNVAFIDSKCLEQLLWLRDYCHENNRQLKLAGLEENCKKILEITRLLGKFDVYEELAPAVKSFA